MKDDKLEAVRSFEHSNYEPTPSAEPIEWVDMVTGEVIGSQCLRRELPQTLDPSTATDAAKDAQSDVGFTVTGTVRLRTYDELMKGKLTPNGEPSSQTQWVLEFDGPTVIRGGRPYGPGGPVTKQAEMVALSPNSGVSWQRYQDKRVTFAYDETAHHFPSDTTMPLGVMHVAPNTNTKL